MPNKPPGGHPDGFWNVNTLNMNVEWDAEGEFTRDINQVSVVDVYADRFVFEQYDFGLTG